ncbi:MAG TPA: metal ABC transporter substrate-binding protein [Candidatus Kryptonia bacterium]|nr:metal ABC transporter substrate-binding protein [Candidatus Kryptonia bacterium]
MKRVLLALLVAMVIAVQPTPAVAKINVVATIPDLAELARRIGGDLVDVNSLATGVEDIHAVPMKPSFAVLLNRADMVVLLGLEAEHAFLPALLEAARNPKILRDGPGYIDCSKYVAVLEVPTRIDRALGDQHPMGNPHYNLDPVSMKLAARAMAEGFAQNYPEDESIFKKNLAAVEADFDSNIARWEREAAPLKGKKLVSYHPDMVYFAERFGMEPVGTIEIRAGVDPTPGHIEELIDRMRREKVDIVVRERHYPAGLAETIAQRTGAKLVELPAMVGGVPEAKTYVGLIDYNLQAMLKAIQS